VASLQVAQACKVILAQGEDAIPCLLAFNLLESEFEEVRL
jgi:hypothetical protein